MYFLAFNGYTSASIGLSIRISEAFIWVSQTLLLLDIEEREVPGERDLNMAIDG